MISESESSENECQDIVPEAIREVANNVSLELLPKKSKQLYTAQYNTFKKWRKDAHSNSFCEDVMIAYFFDLSKKYAPSNLWSIYSMLRLTIQTFDKIDISKYAKLVAFLKRQNTGYKPKKSLVFTKEEISKFLSDAPDNCYLSTKVALIFGIAGALRRVEFCNLLITDVIEKEDFLFVKINQTKNNVPRSFTIGGDLYYICKRYIEARPQPYVLDRFFYKYVNGKSSNQPIGINKFGSMPKEVATYLQLPNVELYTGHSFRRTSATLLVDAGGDITTLKRHGGWKSSTVAEGYIADSLNNKKRIYEQITSGILLKKQALSPSADQTRIAQEPVLDNSSTDHTYKDRTHPLNKTSLINSNSNNRTSTILSKSNCSSTRNHISQIPVVDQEKSNQQQQEENIMNENPHRTSSSADQTRIVQAPVFNNNFSTEQIYEDQTDSLLVDQQQHEEINNNVSNTQQEQHHMTSSSPSTKAQTQKKFEVIYHADAGLCFIDSCHKEHKDSTMSYVFHNCDVTVKGHADQAIIFNNCNITYRDASTND